MTEPNYFLTVFLTQLENKTPTQASKLRMGLAILHRHLLIYPHDPGLASFPLTPPGIQLLTRGEQLHYKKRKYLNYRDT